MPARFFHPRRVLARLIFSLLLMNTSLPPDSHAQPSPGFTRVEQRDGRWWFVDGQDKPFLSLGVDNVKFTPDHIRNTSVSPYGDACLKKYGSLEAWRKAVAQRLFDLGFNSLGAWSDQLVATAADNGRILTIAPTVDLGSGFVQQRTGTGAWLSGQFPDVFDPAFADYCRTAAVQRCTPLRDDAHLTGWFTDNELCWGPDWRSQDELLVRFLNAPEKSPGQVAAVALVRGRYPDVGAFNAVWKTAFASWDDVKGPIKNPYPPAGHAKQNESDAPQTGNPAGDDAARKHYHEDSQAFQEQLADHYFQATADAVRAADPNHLVFGCRFAVNPGAAAIRAAGRHLDAISFNCYEHDPRATIGIYAAAGRPVLIGEYSFRGDDTPLPNTKGAGPRVPTQKVRAAAFQAYATQALSEPALVGLHWFEHADEPVEGRFDGENSNYGIVNINDDLYPDLSAAMKEVNTQANDLHRSPK